MDGKVLIYFRAVIVEDAFCAVECNIRISHQPLFVAVAEHLVKRAIQHFFNRYTFHHCHFRIAVPEDEIHAMSLRIENKLDDAVGQRHIVQQAAFFQHTQGLGLCACQPYFCAQTAVTAQAALAPLKSAAIRHGINAVLTNIYNVVAAYDNSLADAQKLAFRQSGQNTMYRYEQCKFLTVRALNDCFAVFAVNVQDVLCTKVMLLKVCVQIGHRGAPFSVDLSSIPHHGRRRKKFVKVCFIMMFVRPVVRALLKKSFLRCASSIYS